MGSFRAGGLEAGSFSEFSDECAGKCGLNIKKEGKITKFVNNLDEVCIYISLLCLYAPIVYEL